MIIPIRPISGKPIPKGWHGQLWDWIQSMSVSGDKKTIFVKETSQGKMLSGKPFSQEETGNGAGGSDSGYDGPFSVVLKTDTSVTVKANNNLVVIANNTPMTVPETDVINISYSGVVYLAITYTSQYVITVSYNTAVPTASNTTYNHGLAYVKCENGKISSITQLQYGIIQLNGKVF